MVALETNVGCNKFSWRPISKNITSPRPCMVVKMSSREIGDGEHLERRVDESMIVLRLRIKEMKMKMMEMNDNEAPCEWMEWEKKCYDHYDEDVCEAIGFLQCFFMSLRPSVALGLLTLVVMSVMICLGVGFFYALDIARTLLSCFGLS
ncbi:PREDICTED: uncharacterized protein LOC109328594 [Lupinus angustifolius]|uniref:uncharacterized protein LOC109328594 n=1 Tax=Lupinus angustifolius TaxID=3871 RepID=UPI00092F1ABF|nr:PREDICTED: uncharacterized protein LOC109328594 [Lupinus angustifolius]